ncbi:MAG TPA: bifunctional 4-hydroxy-2-oxoglutarate aldolase/2-dehydro-3-deoxy-phosphogluconate aldolase [Thermotogota bacterium]|nr:bifunctional 4-hydroxy-2-oxoglutarate aldolase/2-dehydro-3-deoxy-phosphogluconate aldolase [Thermotogota bacterium]HPJ88985.1 bifunctional 4-hydroxy-2-oxoglutarate aldolase/2-dehydro-3-deoxy-phosphogluconate aldolase [Thermotogota bacterium]HPR97266.1 bifunctional 4-hydroxy-2-oxoglutarate aldolase/2-dehydro-3-deoxy-phosphogluconate aldolase [Thermotogota bacterium]
MEKIGNILKITENKIIAVIREDDPEKILSITDALLKGGVKIFEITFSVPDAPDVIKAVSRQYVGTDVLVGAGTVLDSESARLAILSGAEFVFAPNVNEEVIRTAGRYGKIAVPGALTPTEIVNAREMGADMVKIFPASFFGAKYIKSLKGPLPHLPLIPTGGINSANAVEFLKAGAEAIGVGGSMIDAKAVTAGEYEKITETARRYVSIVENYNSERECRT